MLVDTKFARHVLLVQNRRTPQTSYDVQRVDEGLSATEGGIHLQVEEVVWCCMALTVYRCAVHQRDVHVRRMDAAEQGTVVGQITPTYRERHVHGNLAEVMIAIVVAAHAPGITTEDTMQSLYGVDDGGCSLAQETNAAAVTVIQHRAAQPVGHLTDGNSATGCGNDVVDGRRFRLSQKLPHQ